jgi:hypothetical protein
MKKLIVYILTLLIAAGLFYAYYQYNRGPASLSGKEADVELTARELLSAFQNDEQSANEKYLDKVILVSGIVAESREEEIPTTVVLETGDPLARVVCEMENTNSALNKGEKVSIKAKCTGFLMDVVLVQGVVHN